MQDRVFVLRDAARYDETFLWSARALQFAPDDPIFPAPAYSIADMALKQRLRLKHPEIKIRDGDDFCYPVGDLLAPPERSLVMTIVGHYRESRGDLELARQAYEDACRHNYHGNNEQRDLQRLLGKHGLKPRSGPLMPPPNGTFPRCMKLSCPPHEEASYLARFARQCRRDGNVLQARDALRDLYLFDPGDAEVFRRARELERHPLFQPQLKAHIERRWRNHAVAG